MKDFTVQVPDDFEVPEGGCIIALSCGPQRDGRWHTVCWPDGERLEGWSSDFLASHGVVIPEVQP